MSGGESPDDLALLETGAVGSDQEVTHDATGSVPGTRDVPSAIGAQS